MFIFQYMLISIIITSLALIIIKFKKTGCVFYIVTGITAGWFLTGSLFSLLGSVIASSFTCLGLLGYFGEPEPIKISKRLIIATPLTIAILISVPQYIKVTQRIDNIDENMVIVEGNEVTLAWAPRGPGWPVEGVSWDEAEWICSHLSEDGTKIMDEEVNIWRLPTAKEAVGSMMLHNRNVDGKWNAIEQKATYSKKPDKEYPLWDKHGKVIYYWIDETSLTDPTKAMIIVYHGAVYPRSKTIVMDSLSFRAVKNMD